MNESVESQIYKGDLPRPIDVLEELIEKSGTSVIQCAFRNSFFVNPESVRERTPCFPDAARVSREHYPGKSRGEVGEWQGRSVKLYDNSRAQEAWKKYTGRLMRRSGYGVRHIWGRPWDPNAFTAGWNLCYMPFWVGMLTRSGLAC